MVGSWLVVYHALLILATALGLFLVYQALEHRGKRGATPLLVLVAGALLYVGAKLAVTALQGTPAVFLVTRLTVPGAALATTGFLLVVVEYTGLEYPVSRRTAALLSIQPVVATVVVAIDLEFFWVPVGRDPGTVSGYVWELTSVAVANQLYLTLLMVAGVVLLVQFGLRSARTFTVQVSALLVAGSAQLLGNVVYYLGLVRVNPTPILFVLSGTLIAWAILRGGFLDLVPVGRTEVVDGLGAGVLTVDDDHRLVDVNPAGRRTFGFGDDDAIVGDHVDDAFADRPGFREQYWSVTGSRSDPTFELEFGGRHYDVEVTTLTGGRGTVLGRSFLVTDVTDRIAHERRLRALQETARELSGARTTAEIGEIVVEDAVDVLGREAAVFWEYDPRDDALVPVAEANAGRSLCDDSPISRGVGLPWQVFESGETGVYHDVGSTDDGFDPDPDLENAILVPVDDYGLLATGSTTMRGFEEREVDLFRILGSTVEAALTRARREEELRRQNERLDQFTGVVAHDLRNPLGVAEGYLDPARETGDPAYFEEIESAHDRMERLIDDLLALARGGKTVENPERIDLASVAREAWRYVDGDRATLECTEQLPAVVGDPGRVSQLFENLFRNSVEHGTTSSRPGADVTVTVGELADTEGFYVADDGRGIPPELVDDLFEYGVTGTEDGTGFGLSIVHDIARAHGWRVSATEGSDGGARFEFEFETG